jgi:tetratricopeptide (TPR) repeat protein
MASYSLQRYDEALDFFKRAAALRDDESIPHYYQGLIQYATMDYAAAQTQYQLALDKAGDPGLTYYAMGVNAYAAGKLSDAKVYLQSSYQADPEGHGEKAFALMTRIEGAENASSGL